MVMKYSMQPEHHSVPLVEGPAAPDFKPESPDGASFCVDLVKGTGNFNPFGWAWGVPETTPRKL
jgi:hypothetical protein